MKPRIYLETTLFNYYFLTDVKREKEILSTKVLFNKISKNIFDGFVSAITIQELEQCNDIIKKKNMIELIEKHEINRLILPDYSILEKLADKYITAGAIPLTKKTDALHIATATIGEMDILISWNCDHIVRFKTQQIVKAINVSEGFTDISINTPEEVIHNE